MDSLKDQLQKVRQELRKQEAESKIAAKTDNDAVRAEPAAPLSNVPSQQIVIQKRTAAAHSGERKVDVRYGKVKPWVRKPVPNAAPRPVSRPEDAKPAAPPKQPEAATPSTPPSATPPSAEKRHFVAPSLTKLEEFKVPDRWVTDGVRLQLQEGAKKRHRTVVMGIDFGTAYTKVALKIAGAVFFVTWEGVRASEYPFLMPGELSVDGSRKVWFGQCSNRVNLHANLKMPLLATGSRPLTAPETVVFLALVMQYARAWLFHHHPELCEGYDLAWTVNLGCPTRTWESGDIKAAYDRMGRCAWKLSRIPGDMTVERAVGFLNPKLQTPGCAEIGLDALGIMPEFIAQLVGYVQSPQRREGLHCLVDIGAGTLDVAVFNVYHEAGTRDDRFPIFACDVHRLGTHFLMRKRQRDAERESDRWSDLHGIPEAAGLATEWGVTRHVIDSADGEFAGRVSEAIGERLRYTKARRYRRAPEWQDGLRTFLCGGGSGFGLYKEALMVPFRSMRTPLRLVDLDFGQKVMNFGGSEATPFHRMSVAYGLTYDVDTVGKILPPADIEDDDSGPRIRERPDRDELYPK